MSETHSDAAQYVDRIKPESQLPQRMIFAVAVTIDLVIAAGLLPLAYTSLVRSVVMFLLYREWALAAFSGFVLPRFFPLAGVCFFKQKWLGFKGQFKVVTASSNDWKTAAASRSSNVEHAGGVGSTAPQRRQRPTREEVSGYDVSAASSEDVIELSSWKAESKNTSGPSDTLGARRRGAPR